jgi:hypothetical protein
MGVDRRNQLLGSSKAAKRTRKFDLAARCADNTRAGVSRTDLVALYEWLRSGGDA